MDSNYLSRYGGEHDASALTRTRDRVVGHVRPKAGDTVWHIRCRRRVLVTYVDLLSGGLTYRLADSGLGGVTVFANVCPILTLWVTTRQGDNG